MATLFRAICVGLLAGLLVGGCAARTTEAGWEPIAFWMLFPVVGGVAFALTLLLGFARDFDQSDVESPQRTDGERRKGVCDE